MESYKLVKGIPPMHLIGHIRAACKELGYDFNSSIRKHPERAVFVPYLRSFTFHLSKGDGKKYSAEVCLGKKRDDMGFKSRFKHGFYIIEYSAVCQIGMGEDVKLLDEISFELFKGLPHFTIGCTMSTKGVPLSDWSIKFFAKDPLNDKDLEYNNAKSFLEEIINRVQNKI